MKSGLRKNLLILISLLLAFAGAYFFDSAVFISGSFQVRPQFKLSLTEFPSRVKKFVFKYFYPEEEGQGGGRPTFFPGQASPTPADKLESFAKCLTQKGLTMYGKDSCDFCQKQKELFGAAFQFINYVECSVNEEICSSKGIVGTPTWEDLSGKRYLGKQSLENLSQMANCPL